MIEDNYKAAARLIATTEEQTKLPVRIDWDDQLTFGAILRLSEVEWSKQLTIKDWSTKYLVLASSVEVEMQYTLVDTKTGIVLWENNQPYVHSSGGGDPITMVVSAALNALLTDYLPLAREANKLAFLPPRGFPVGQYHPKYQNDKSLFE